MMQLLHNATGHPPNPNTTIVMCGITKLFVGDLIETGMFRTQASSPICLAPSYDTWATDLQCSLGNDLSIKACYWWNAARVVAAEAGERGALRPVHVQKAYQRLDQEGKNPHRGQKRARRLRL